MVRIQVDLINELYRLGNAAPLETDCPEIYGAAAYGNDAAAIFFSYFDERLEQGEKEIAIHLNGDLAGKTASLYRLSQNSDNELIGKFSADQPIKIELELYNACLIKIK